jgi:hypothetical protein
MTCACGGDVRAIVEPGLPDSLSGTNAFRNLLGIAPPDWHRWRVTECASCGRLEFYREPQAVAEARLRAARERAETLRRELTRLGQ